jgi:hypothetical protein
MVDLPGEHRGLIIGALIATTDLPQLLLLRALHTQETDCSGCGGVMLLGQEALKVLDQGDFDPMCMDCFAERGYEITEESLTEAQLQTIGQALGRPVTRNEAWQKLKQAWEERYGYHEEDQDDAGGGGEV